MNKPITAYAIYDGEGDIVEFSHVSGAQAWSNFTGIGDKETGYYPAITRLVNEGFTCWEVTICPEGWVCVPKDRLEEMIEFSQEGDEGRWVNVFHIKNLLNN